ncbi:MAG TPA: ribonuclease P protein component [Candidatus Babeliales bacterium]|nr:ribonuclease P protein component [Candidatus Babeliales bacterium]
MSQQRWSVSRFQPAEVQALLQTYRRRYRRAGLEFVLAPRALAQARILVVIARRVIKSAVQRNLLRRRLKALFFELELVHGPVDLIVFVKTAEATQLEFKALQQLLIQVQQLPLPAVKASV